MEFHDNYPQYEMMAHHDEVKGKKMRRILWNVFWIMLAITIIELVVGFIQDGQGWTGTLGIKLFFIIATLGKAYFIVYYFMHLKYENRLMRAFIMYPYIGFVVYLIAMTVMGEGNYAFKHKTLIDPIIQMQHSGGGHGGGGGDHGGEEHKGGGDHHKF